MVVAHCRDTWWLGTAGIHCGSALQGYPVVGHCRDTLRLGTAGILGGWALQGYFAVGHIREALQGYSLVGHCRDTWWLVTKVSFQSCEDNIYFKISQTHCEGGEQKDGLSECRSRGHLSAGTKDSDLIKVIGTEQLQTDRKVLNPGTLHPDCHLICLCLRRMMQRSSALAVLDDSLKLEVQTVRGSLRASWQGTSRLNSRPFDSSCLLLAATRKLGLQ